MHHPHPQVMDSLARNPKLLAHEAVSILRMHTILPHTIEVIGKDPRWTGHEQVQILVVTHGNTPLSVADAVLARMSRGALQKVIQTSGLRRTLRDKVLRRLPRR